MTPFPHPTYCVYTLRGGDDADKSRRNGKLAQSDDLLGSSRFSNQSTWRSSNSTLGRARTYSNRQFERKIGAPFFLRP